MSHPQTTKFIESKKEAQEEISQEEIGKGWDEFDKNINMSEYRIC